MSIVSRSGRLATSHSARAAASRNKPAPTSAAGKAPIISPSGHRSESLPGVDSSGITQGPMRNSEGGDATIVESHTHWRLSAMLLTPPSARVWPTSAHGLNALTDTYG
jgi:hypothetical protein